MIDANEIEKAFRLGVTVVVVASVAAGMLAGAFAMWVMR